jgi:hypothetical protein
MQDGHWLRSFGNNTSNLTQIFSDILFYYGYSYDYI